MLSNLARSMPAGRTIPSGAGATTSSQSTSSVPAALGIENRQFALHILAATGVASHGLIGFVEGAQDFIFFLAVETNVFIDWHRNLPYILYITP
jgi:hypothetical protein